MGSSKTDSDLKKAHIAEIVNDINMKKQNYEADQISQVSSRPADATKVVSPVIPVTSKQIA